MQSIYFDTRNNREVIRQIFIDCKSIYKVDIEKAKRKRLKKKFKRFINIKFKSIKKHESE